MPDNPRAYAHRHFRIDLDGLAIADHPRARQVDKEIGAGPIVYSRVDYGNSRATRTPVASPGHG
jgi:hypothetical protein